MDEMIEIGKRIAERRIAKGLNQSELARALDVTPQAVQKWEAGISSPRNKRMHRLAGILNTSVQYILSGKELIHDEQPGQAVAEEPPPQPIIVCDAYRLADPETQAVVNFVLQAPDAPLPGWANEDMRGSINTMRYAVTRWMRGQKKTS